VAGNIFINYRRDDDAGFTQALYSRLEQAFPSESLFMDVDNIAPGLDFVQVLNDEVARCDVVIAVIGKNWLSVNRRNWWAAARQSGRFRAHRDRVSARPEETGDPGAGERREDAAVDGASRNDAGLRPLQCGTPHP
jgi:hypothetical protein